MEVETRKPGSEELPERLFRAGLGALELFNVYVGDRLGYYRELSCRGATPDELAQRTHTHRRYAREWLERQAVAGILTVDDASRESGDRHYMLPADHAEVLVERESMNSVTPLARTVIGCACCLPAVLVALQSGGGVAWRDFGDDVREGQANFNRALFLGPLVSEYLRHIEDVHRRLSSDPPARVADVACGAGWSSIAIAKAYPRVSVDGFDIDAPALDLARRHATETGVADRVRFFRRYAADPTLDYAYDLVTIFEAVYDISWPVDALRDVRRMLTPGGVAIVMDERVGERFTGPGDEIERLMYGFSSLLCLPSGMAEQPSAATGTVMRPDTLRRYAREAGFQHVEILPIEAPFRRFYRLIP